VNELVIQRCRRGRAYALAKGREQPRRRFRDGSSWFSLSSPALRELRLDTQSGVHNRSMFACFRPTRRRGSRRAAQGENGAMPTGVATGPTRAGTRGVNAAVVERVMLSWACTEAGVGGRAPAIVASCRVLSHLRRRGGGGARWRKGLPATLVGRRRRSRRSVPVSGCPLRTWARPHDGLIHIATLASDGPHSITANVDIHLCARSQRQQFPERPLDVCGELAPAFARQVALVERLLCPALPHRLDQANSFFHGGRLRGVGCCLRTLNGLLEVSDLLVADGEPAPQFGVTRVGGGDPLVDRHAGLEALEGGGEVALGLLDIGAFQREWRPEGLPEQILGDGGPARPRVAVRDRTENHTGIQRLERRPGRSAGSRMRDDSGSFPPLFVEGGSGFTAPP
jgi:hypothetical protein